MTLSGFVSCVLVGTLAGWLSGVFTKGRGFGLAGNIIIGISGAFLGGFCSGRLGISAHGSLGQLIFAVLGSLVVVWLLQFIKR